MRSPNSDVWLILADARDELDETLEKAEAALNVYLNSLSESDESKRCDVCDARVALKSATSFKDQLDCALQYFSAQSALTEGVAA